MCILILNRLLNPFYSIAQSSGDILDTVKFVCLCWGLTSQSTIFQSCRDGATASWVINQYFRGVKCLAQGHNTAAVGIEPPTSRSGVRHSTTEPPRSPQWDWWACGMYLGVSKMPRTLRVEGISVGFHAKSGIVRLWCCLRNMPENRPVKHINN